MVSWGDSFDEDCQYLLVRNITVFERPEDHLFHYLCGISPQASSMLRFTGIRRCLTQHSILLRCLSHRPNKWRRLLPVTRCRVSHKRKSTGLHNSDHEATDTRKHLIPCLIVLIPYIQTCSCSSSPITAIAVKIMIMDLLMGALCRANHETIMVIHAHQT